MEISKCISEIRKDVHSAAKIFVQKAIKTLLIIAVLGGMKLKADEESGIGFKIDGKSYEEGRKKIAMLVGVEKTAFFNGNLENAEKDISEIGRNLEQKGGFSIHTLIGNPSAEKIRQEIEKTINLLESGSIFLFYFTGHGQISEPFNGDTWMYANDTDPKNIKETSIQESRILELIKKKNSTLVKSGKKEVEVIFMINACRENKNNVKKDEDYAEKFSEFLQKYPRVTRFYSSQIGFKSINKQQGEELSLFTYRFVQAINNSAIPKNEMEESKKKDIKKEKIKESNQTQDEKEVTRENHLKYGADSTVNGGDGNRQITLVEIKRFMTNNLEEKEKPHIYIADGMHDFVLVDLDKSFDPWKYVWRSMILPGWGEFNYGRDYEERKSGWLSYYVLGPSYMIIYAGLLGKTISDYRMYNNKQTAFRNEPLVPAQILGFDTILYNYWNLTNKKANLQRAEHRYNESAAILLGFWTFNVLQSYLVPIINNKYPDLFSLQFDFRPVSNGQEIYANMGQWERYATFQLKWDF